MRQVFFGHPSNSFDNEQFKKWVAESLYEIELASQDDIALMFKDFTVTNFTDTRTLDASTATASDVAKVLCTLIYDIQKRGMKRSQ